MAGWGGRLALTWLLCPSPHPHRHIFLGFSKCGRYVLSYTSSSGDDDFSFYIYHLYWWEFNVHSKLKLVGPGLTLGCPFQQHGSHWSRHPSEPQVSCPQSENSVLMGPLLRLQVLGPSVGNWHF